MWLRPGPQPVTIWVVCQPGCDKQEVCFIFQFDKRCDWNECRASRQRTPAILRRISIEYFRKNIWTVAATTLMKRSRWTWKAGQLNLLPIISAEYIIKAHLYYISRSELFRHALNENRHMHEVSVLLRWFKAWGKSKTSMWYWLFQRTINTELGCRPRQKSSASDFHFWTVHWKLLSQQCWFRSQRATGKHSLASGELCIHITVGHLKSNTVRALWEYKLDYVFARYRLR